jgi:hypothetical protein
VRLDTWTVRLIVGAVVVGWLASLVASMISSFEPPDTLNALFLALAGSALAINGNEHMQNKHTPTPPQLPAPDEEREDSQT